jgi:hypothetical protein
MEIVELPGDPANELHLNKLKHKVYYCMFIWY